VARGDGGGWPGWGRSQAAGRCSERSSKPRSPRLVALIPPREGRRLHRALNHRTGRGCKGKSWKATVSCSTIVERGKPAADQTAATVFRRCPRLRRGRGRVRPARAKVRTVVIMRKGRSGKIRQRMAVAEHSAER
jgi:hypothetical protein